MKDTKHRLMASELLDLVWQMEQVLKNYCRWLTVNDDGHLLETENDNEPL